MENKNCLLCEVQDKIVESIDNIKFNGDCIPVCEYHYKLIKDETLYNFLDEQHYE